jgi:hypothetical protein
VPPQRRYVNLPRARSPRRIAPPGCVWSGPGVLAPRAVLTRPRLEPCGTWHSDTLPEESGRFSSSRAYGMTASIPAACGPRGLPGPTGRFTHRRAIVTSDKQPGSSGWHSFQLRSGFYPSERLSLEPHETRFDWQGANCPRTPSCWVAGNSETPSPRVQARGLQDPIQSVPSPNADVPIMRA